MQFYTYIPRYIHVLYKSREQRPETQPINPRHWKISSAIFSQNSNLYWRNDLLNQAFSTLEGEIETTMGGTRFESSRPRVPPTIEPPKRMGVAFSRLSSALLKIQAFMELWKVPGKAPSFVCSGPEAGFH